MRRRRRRERVKAPAPVLALDKRHGILPPLLNQFPHDVTAISGTVIEPIRRPIGQ